MRPRATKLHVRRCGRRKEPRPEAFPCPISVDGEAVARQSHGRSRWYNPAMSGIKLVVFDIAGTIIEDHGEVIGAFARALMENGIPFTEDELKRWKGASKREVIRHFVTQADPNTEVEEKVETAYRSFRSELERCYREKLVPIAGALETFRWCRDRGMLLATTTGFYREISDLVLNETGWRDLFAANISSSDVRQGRPAPYLIFRAMEATGVHSVKQVMNVGD